MASPDEDLAATLARRHFEVAGDDLAIEGWTVADLAARHGTPFFAYSADVIRRQYQALSAAVAGFAGIAYSIKTNPNPAIAAVLLGEGAGIEVASAGEMRLAIAAGAHPARMLAAGPGKTDRDLAAFVAAGIGEIHLEGMGEIDRLDAIAAAAGRVQNVSLRINPADSAVGGAMRMGGKPTAFGFDEELIPQAVGALAACGALDLHGIHLYAGTQILDADALVALWRYGLDLAGRVARIAGRPLSSIDLGGGLGIPYYPGEASLDLAKVKAAVPDLVAALKADPMIAAASVIVEPGRFLVGPAGIYVARVTEVKRSRGKLFAITDGGMHHHLAASGNLGQIVKRDYPLLAPARMGAPLSDEAVTVAGPLCTPLDVLGRSAKLPALAPGDLVAVLQSGAYGLTASPVGFLSHDAPAELLIDGAEERVIRPAIAADSWLGGHAG